MKQNSKGFSYVEMLMVLAIMAIMIGMVTISIGLVRRNTLSRTSEKLESLVNKARTKALTQGSTHQGYLNISEVPGKGIYAYVGEEITSDDYNDVKSHILPNGNRVEGDKLCSSEYEIIVSGESTNPKSDDYEPVITIGFLQSSGGVRGYNDKSIIIKKKGTSKTSGFNVYGLTGKTWR